MPPADWTRRNILVYGSVGMAAAGYFPTTSAAPQKSKPLRAVIIGATGAGNYGHSMDRLFDDLTGVEVVAIADADESGRAKKQEELKVEKAYAGYRQMLDEQKPDLAVVASRWTDQHHAMTIAALEAGAHVYLEKPMAQTLREADEMVGLADKKGLRIAVAHQMRCDPNILELQRALESEDLIGKLIEIRAFGKMDHRVGGEDLVVLGTHLLDLIRLFAGDPTSVTARVRNEDGTPAEMSDVHKSEKEALGPLLGRDLRATFAMDSGVDVTFISQPEMGNLFGPWGLELIGTKGKARVFANVPPTISVTDSAEPDKADRTEVWKQWPETSPYHEKIDGLSGMKGGNRRVVHDWLAAIEEGREPMSSGQRALKSLEMIHSVWTSGLSGQRVSFPLENRDHPLL